jgi:KDO2-lipid IV(A) lauroyltransferase
MAALTAVFERYIGAYPDQWYNLFDYWGIKDKKCSLGSRQKLLHRGPL